MPEKTIIMAFILMFIFYALVWIYYKLFSDRNIFKEYRLRELEEARQAAKPQELTVEEDMAIATMLDNARAIERVKYYLTDMTALPNTLYDEYQQYLRSRKWKNLRHQAIKRDNFRCTGCGYIGVLEVHHTHYKGVFEMEFSVDQLISVCHECHEDIHTKLRSK